MKRKFFLVILLIFLSFSLHAVSSTWFYDSLSSREKELYSRIGEAILHTKDEIDDIPFSSEDSLRIYMGYLDDHPGIFWAGNGITYRTYYENGEKKHGIIFSYTHRENLYKDQLRFISLVDKFSSYLKNDKSDWEKLYHIYDYLAQSIEYSTSYMDQSMWSVFFEGIGVCAGFARSFQYLALLEGIPAVVVHGWGIEEDGARSKDGHLWVMAEIDGKWYHFDPTWALDDGNDGEVDFTYFCRSRERMELTHIIDERYKIPQSGDDTMSLVYLEGRYLKRYSRSKILEIIKRAEEAKERTVVIEFGSLREMEKAEEDLFTNSKIFDLLKEAGTAKTRLTYALDKRTYSMKLLLQ